jgi:hypothetical protein
MPWKIVADHPECPVSRPVGVVDPDGGVKCHRNQSAARAQVRIMAEAEGMTMDEAMMDE